MKSARRIRLQLAGWMLASVLTLLVALPETVTAQPNKSSGTTCGGCHNGALSAGQTVSAAVNGVAGTSFTVAAGSTIEIDWIYKAMRGYTPTRGVTSIIGLPAGWTIASTTNGSNPATLGGQAWVSAWDNAPNKAGSTLPTWQVTGAETGTVPTGMTSTNVYKHRFDGTAWMNGSGSAFDDGSASDLDGVTNVMGADARITLPASGGPFTIYVGGVGHGASAKAMATAAITITLSGGGDVTAPTPGTVNVSPQSGSYVPAAFTITTAFTDAESAVTACDYTLNGGGAWTAGVVSGTLPNFTCTASITGQTNGTALTVNMRATSSGGTATATQLARTVDAAAPTTTSNAPAGWQANDVTVTLTPTDGTGSGVAGTQYCVDTANSCVPGTSGATVNVTQGAGTAGTQYVRFRATDNLGNVETTKSATVQIDKAVPTDGTLNITPGNGQNGLSWTAAADVGSGLRAANTYDLRYLTGATPPTCATGTSIYLGTGTGYTHTPLTNGTTYSYRLCAYDNVNNVSTGAFGSGTPVLVNNPPGVPTALTQYRSDGITTVAADAWTNSASPVMKGTVTDPDGDTVRLEVEILPMASGFTNSPNCTTGALVTSGGTASASCGPLADGTYKWQARGQDSIGAAGSWEQFASATFDIGIDTTPPTESGLTATPGDTVVGLTWNPAADGAGSGLDPTNSYKVVRSAGSTPADCSGAAVYQGNLNLFNDSGLANGITYYYRVCAYDRAGNVSSGQTTSATPGASCTVNPPAVSILGSNKTISVDGGFADYTVQVTNNDVGACSAWNFDLVVVDSNGTAFYVSTVATDPLTIAAGGTAQTTVRVTAKPNQSNGTTNSTYFYTAAGGGHAQSANANAMATTIGVSGGGCVAAGNYLNANGDQLTTSR